MCAGPSRDPKTYLLAEAYAFRLCFVFVLVVWFLQKQSEDLSSLCLWTASSSKTHYWFQEAIFSPPVFFPHSHLSLLLPKLPEVHLQSYLVLSPGFPAYRDFPFNYSLLEKPQSILNLCVCPLCLRSHDITRPSAELTRNHSWRSRRSSPNISSLLGA